MKTRLRTAILGCGKVAHLHANALAALPESDFAAVCDADYTRAQAFADRYGARAFASYDDMLASGIDVVVICTPHPLHRAGALAAAAAKVHTLVEKPLASSVADCDAMIAAAERNGIQLGVVSQRRYFAPVLRMKAAIDSGKIGTPILGTVSMFSWRDEAYYRSDPWRGKWDTEGGGVLINQSPHHLDILQWLMGPIEEITGRWANLNHPYIEVEDTALGIVRFQSGALASITVSVSQRPGIYTKIHVHGSNGASVGTETDSGATFIAGMSNVADLPFNDIWTIPGEEHLLDHFRREDAGAFRGVDPTAHFHRLQVEDFLQSVLAGRPPAVTGTEGRKVVQIIESIYRSGREAKPSKI